MNTTILRTRVQRGAVMLAVSISLSVGVGGAAHALQPFPALDQALGQPAPAAGLATGAGTGATVAAGGPVATGPSRAEANAREISERFPAASRAGMASALVKSLDVYRKIEAAFGWPEGDMAGSMAAFLVGNYMVMTGAEVPDEQFSAVARQLRSSQRLRDSLSQRSARELRDAYEQQAMVGAFMAITLKANATTPIPAQAMANLRDTARANLRLALNADPDTMRIGPDGIRLGR